MRFLTFAYQGGIFTEGFLGLPKSRWLPGRALNWPGLGEAGEAHPFPQEDFWRRSGDPEGKAFAVGGPRALLDMDAHGGCFMHVTKGL